MKIKNLEQLNKAALNKQCVVVPDSACFRNRMPAAWIQNMQGITILQLFKMGMFLYKKKKTTKLYGKPMPFYNVILKERVKQWKV